MQNKVKYPTQTLRFSFALDYDQKGVSSVATEIEIRVLTERNYKLSSYLRQVQRNVDSSRGEECEAFFQHSLSEQSNFARNTYIYIGYSFH